MRVFNRHTDTSFVVGSSIHNNLDIVNSDYNFIRPDTVQGPSSSSNPKKRMSGKNIPELHIDVELSRNALFFGSPSLQELQQQQQQQLQQQQQQRAQQQLQQQQQQRVQQQKASKLTWQYDELQGANTRQMQHIYPVTEDGEPDQHSHFYEALGFPHVRRRASSVETRHPQLNTASPPLLPALSPSSSSSSLASAIDTSFQQTSPYTAPPSYGQPFHLTPPTEQSHAKPPHIPLLIRRTRTPSKATPNHRKRMSWSPSAVTTSSWADVPVSPAASFLSAFAACETPMCDEEGDEIGEYTLGKIIGYGGFSTVREGLRLDERTGKTDKVAIKIVKKNLDSRGPDAIQYRLEREVAVWRMLNHPNIVRFYDFFEMEFAYFVVSEFCSGGHLLDYVTRHGKAGLREDDARRIFRQLCHAVRYLHDDMKVCHKDLKLENVLFDAHGDIKLCDFGLAEFQNDDVAHHFLSLSPLSAFRRTSLIPLDLEDEMAGGSLAYASPEQLRSDTPLRTPSSDIWSLGVILFALVTGRLPFMDEYEPRMQYKILNARYDEPENVSHECRDLIRECFNTKPQQRINVRQILDSEWIDY